MAAFSAGQTLLAADLIRILPIPAIKLADESVNNSTTLQNDNELVAAGTANTNYMVALHLLVMESVGTGIDIKMAWTQPTGCILDLANLGPHASWNATAANLEVEHAAWQNETGTTTSTKTYGTTNSAVFSYRFNGTWRVGGSGGNLQLQWAQQNATVGNVTVKAGSSLILTPLLT